MRRTFLLLLPLSLFACAVSAEGRGPDGVSCFAPDASMDSTTVGWTDPLPDVVPPDIMVPEAQPGMTPVEASVDAETLEDAEADAPHCDVYSCGGACCGDYCIPRDKCGSCGDAAMRYCIWPENKFVPNSNGFCAVTCPQP